MRLTFVLIALLTPATLRAQWEIQDSHTTASLRGIHALGNGIAWASGSSGTVLHTTDDGKTWQLCPTPPNGEKLDFRGVQAFDASTAIVMSSGKGDLSRLYKTTDACRTWTLLFTNPDPEGFWDAISFRRSSDSELHGWIFGDPVDGRFRVFQSTSDDGSVFTADDTPSLAAPSAKAGAFAASNSSFFVLPEGPALPTGPPLPPPPPGTRRKDNYRMVKQPVEWFVTGGIGGSRVYVRQPDWMFDFAVKVEWISLPLPLGTDTEASGAFAIEIRSMDSGVVVGGDYSKPETSLRSAAYRDPKSHSWVSSQTPPHGYRSSVAYSPATKTWITVGPNGTDISTDDGRNWRALRPTPTEPPDADRNWNALSLPFVVGPHGRIGKLRPTALTQAGAAKP